jgi:hypothetical protein
VEIFDEGSESMDDFALDEEEDSVGSGSTKLRPFKTGLHESGLIVGETEVDLVGFVGISDEIEEEMDGMDGADIDGADMDGADVNDADIVDDDDVEGVDGADEDWLGGVDFGAMDGENMDGENMDGERMDGLEEVLTAEILDDDF